MGKYIQTNPASGNTGLFWMGASRPGCGPPVLRVTTSSAIRWARSAAE